MIENLKQLSEAEKELRKIKYPSLPDYARTTKKYTDKTANGLTAAIVDWLNLSGGFGERISVTGRRIDKTKVVTDCLGGKRVIGSARWIKSSMKKGSADVAGHIRFPVDNPAGHPIPLKVEVKIGKDTQKKNQKGYENDMVRTGALYCIATCFEDFINFVKNNNYVRV
jgi:hypothetical protein